MKARKKPAIRTKVVLPIGVLAAVMGLLLTSGPAQAATWTSSTNTTPSAQDPGGVDAYSNLKQDGTIYYRVLFEAHGEDLAFADSLADGHAARAEVIVVDGNGKFMDSDTFYAGTADGAVWLNLGTPDGSGNIPEGYEVRIRVCINETTTCSWWEYGVA